MKRSDTQTKHRTPSADGELRRAAEARLHNRQGTRRAATGVPTAAVDTQRMLHELQVHQVELEMQNAELQATREKAEGALEKYADLYEFAPVGYFTIDRRGFILEANLRGTVLLGVDRPDLIRRRLQSFVAAPGQASFLNFLEKAFSGPDKQRCEVSVVNANGIAFWADIQAVPEPMRKRCRVVVSDVTSLKRGEEAQRQATALAGTNQTLRQEIVRRQTVEDALRRAERHQARLVAESHQMQDQLRALSHQVLQAQEEERRRISRELHDNITQTLIGISVQLAGLVQAGTRVPARLKLRVANVQALVADSVNIVHQFARELRPAMLDDLGLVTSLHAFMKDFAKRTGITARLTSSAGLERLDNDQRLTLYRVAQSALTNVAEHAKASRVSVSVRKLRGIVHLEISDDGQSFDVERITHTKGHDRLGLLGMRERVQMIGGNLSIESAPGRGTTIRATIPVTSGSARRPSR